MSAKRPNVAPLRLGGFLRFGHLGFWIFRDGFFYAFEKAVQFLITEASESKIEPLCLQVVEFDL